MSAIVDDVAPKGNTTLWLAVFYTAGPVGVACGFFLGSVLGNSMSWRYVFLFEASVALPLVLWCFVTKPFKIKRDCTTSNGVGTAEGEGEENSGSSAWSDLKRLLKHIVFDLSISGELLHFAFLTICEYWGSRIVAAVFSNDQADIFFGAATVVGCIVGGVLGGVILDAIGTSSRRYASDGGMPCAGSSVRNALSLSSVACFATGIILAPAILLLKNFYVFILCMLLCFAVTSLTQVKPYFR